MHQYGVKIVCCPWAAKDSEIWQLLEPDAGSADEYNTFLIRGNHSYITSNLTQRSLQYILKYPNQVQCEMSDK